MLTRKNFLEILRTLDPEPNFLVCIIEECFKRLPDAVSWKLAHQLYINYFWDGEVLKIKSLLSGEELLFTSYEEVTSYLKKLGYKTNVQGVRRAFSNRAPDYCCHSFYRDAKEEITYFE